MTKLLNWQKEILKNISKMSNLDLLENTIGLAGGDDYDGCFTDHGQWEFDKLRDELYRRLSVAKFLTEKQFIKHAEENSLEYSEGWTSFYNSSFKTEKVIFKNKYNKKDLPKEAALYRKGWVAAKRCFEHSR